MAWLEKSPKTVKSNLAEIEKHGLKMYAIYSTPKSRRTAT